MRVLSWNIHYWLDMAGGSNLNGVAEVLAASHADIIGLNEVAHPRMVAGDTRPALTALAERLGMHVGFGPWKRWPAHLDMPGEGFGNALLSRWPIIASAGHHLSSTPGVESRGLLEARLLLPDGRTFTVYVTHLDHQNEEERARQFRTARTWLVRDRNRPHLLLGDINAITAEDFAARPHDLAALHAHPTGCNLVEGEKGPQVLAQVEKAGYVDLHRRCNGAGGRSYVPAQIDLRIDYIFASQALAPFVRSCAILDTADGISDHRPVVADFDLPAATATA